MVDAYLAVNANFVVKQSNVSEDDDFAPVPDGYVLFGARAGTTFKWVGQRYMLGLEVQNAF